MVRFCTIRTRTVTTSTLQNYGRTFTAVAVYGTVSSPNPNRRQCPHRAGLRPTTASVLSVLSTSFSSRTYHYQATVDVFMRAYFSLFLSMNSLCLSMGSLVIVAGQGTRDEMSSQKSTPPVLCDSGILSIIEN